MSDRCYCSITVAPDFKKTVADGLVVSVDYDQHDTLEIEEFNDWDVLRELGIQGCIFHGYHGGYTGSYNPGVFAAHGGVYVHVEANENEQPVVEVKENGEVDSQGLVDVRCYRRIHKQATQMIDGTPFIKLYRAAQQAVTVLDPSNARSILNAAVNEAEAFINPKLKEQGDG